uniref:NADH dehydrogenase subunit 6 n=1 Tax=Gracixalus yunnanensis TaxID=2596631 RepID=UPI001F145221|nr:NADH dehydrogenase subunit 6 [Gracixalus yunnanensis]UMI33293.1 NADH dehydrogenase subunit 6 [Gracixalus yunnanensis]
MISEVCLLLGFLAVASNPSPFYAALGLVWAAGASCFVLMKGNLGFLPLVLFLIYLGGMMVVFAYCSALAAEPHPEAWGGHVVLCFLMVYCVVMLMGVAFWGAFWYDLGLVIMSEPLLAEWWGVSELMGDGGWVLFFCGWGLLMTLFIVLEVVRGRGSGALRAV